MTDGTQPVTRPDLPSQHLARATLASTQLLVAAIVRVLVAVPLLILAPWQYAPLAGWDIAATALRHALLSYLFATGILAAAINVVVSLTSP